MWWFVDGESGVANHQWRLVNADATRELVPPVDAGPLHSGTANVQLTHGEVVCAQARAQNWAGSWQPDWESRCFIVDLTASIMGAPVWLPVDPDDLGRDDGWLLGAARDTARDLVERVANQGRTDALPEGTLNVTQWAASVLTAAGEPAPFVDARVPYETAWDAALAPEDNMPYLLRSYGVFEPRLASELRRLATTLDAALAAQRNGTATACGCVSAAPDALAVELARASALLAEFEAAEAHVRDVGILRLA